jgi:hypothetical protein
MKSWLLFPVLICVFLMSSAALADNIVTTGTWSDLTNEIVNNNGDPFWDHLPSGDVGYKNVGGEILTFGLTNPQYLSSSNNPVNVTFAGTGSGQQETLILEIAGFYNNNALYAYNVTYPNEKTLIFKGTENSPPAGSSVVVNNINITYASYGFLLVSGNGNYYYSGSVSGTEAGHFAFFREENTPLTWWFGIEDLPVSGYGCGDKDYQDMIVKLVTSSGFTPVPVPPSALLLGSGLLGLVGLRKVRKG